MQIADKYSNGAFPPGGGGAPDITDQLQQQRAYHRRILWQRTLGLWWPRILLIALGGLVAGIAGQFVLNYPLYILAPPFALVLLFLITWRTQFGLFFVAVISTAISPQLLSVKSLSIYPALPLLIWLFFVLMIQAAFRIRKPVLPSFWTIWPLLGLVCMAFVSDILIQVTWTYGVAHKIGSEPIIFDEIFGIAMFFLPLITVAVTTAAITKKEKWIEYIQTAFLLTSVILGLVVIIQFKRIGATIDSFRFSDPKLAWMSLKAISQILALGAMIGYARFLYATRWSMRIINAVAVVIIVLSIYFCLQNSWWLEIGLAMIVMTLGYSRRLFVVLSFLSLPLLPLVKLEIDKLATVKTADFYRLIIWQDALRVWSKHPLFGVGPGNYWAYDLVFTQLPLYLRQFNKTGLGVTHNGYLQILGELGPVGLFFYLAFMVVMIITSVRLLRRSNTPETRNDRILALVALGLVCGSAAGDFTSGAMFLQPRQVGSSVDISHVLSTWFIFGFVMYKDQLWRMARWGLRLEK